MKKYEYIYVNESKLTALKEKYVVIPIAKMLPKSLSPNVITFGSMTFSFIMLISNFLVPSVTIRSIIVILSLIIYIFFDTLDGIFARLNGTMSHFGEFFDHFHDAYAQGILCYSMLNLIDGCGLFAALFIIAYYTDVVRLFHSQRQTGTMFLDKVGSIEGELFLSILFLLSFNTTISTHFSLCKPLYFKLFMLILILFITSTLIRSTLNKKCTANAQLLTYFLCTASTIYSCTNLRLGEMALLFTIYNTDFLSRIIDSRLKSTEYPWPDMSIPALMLFAKVVPTHTPFLLFASLSYLFCKILVLFTKNISLLPSANVDLEIGIKRRNHET